MRSPNRLLLMSCVAAIAACLPDFPDPSAVTDLRVLGASFEPPELMGTRCDVAAIQKALFSSAVTTGVLDGGALPQEVQQGLTNFVIALLPAVVQPVTFSALVADPKGEGRKISFELRACANSGDRECDDENVSFQVASGEIPVEGLSVTFQPGIRTLDGGNLGNLIDTQKLIGVVDPQLLGKILGIDLTPFLDGGNIGALIDAGVLQNFLDAGVPGLTDGGLLNRVLAAVPPEKLIDAGVIPSFTQLQDSLLIQSLRNDTFLGLGGIRVQVVLHVFAGDEQVYAKKLMVYSCKQFDDARNAQNETPKLEGISVDGNAWDDSDGGIPPLLAKGKRKYAVSPYDFSLRQQEYTVSAFDLTPLVLSERWKIQYYADYGTFDPNQTGGSGLVGVDGIHSTFWKLPPNFEARDKVNFWFVVQDGRGGESWIHREMKLEP